MAPEWDVRTRLVQADADSEEEGAPLNTPLVLSTTFRADPGGVGFSASDLGEESPFFYARWSTPTVRTLEKRLAELEGGEDALCFASGMAAITGLLLQLLRPGKELPILQQHSVHIGFSNSGIEFDVVPAFEQPSQHVYFIPERDTGRWIRTNPKRHEELSTQANERAGKKLKPLLKAVKHWNRHHASSPLGSFHLEAMSYSAFPQPPAGGIWRLWRHSSPTSARR